MTRLQQPLFPAPPLPRDTADGGALFDRNPDAGCVLEGRGVIVRTNAAWPASFAGEWAGRELVALVDPRDAAHAAAWARRAVEGEGGCTYLRLSWEGRTWSARAVFTPTSPGRAIALLAADLPEGAEPDAESLRDAALRGDGPSFFYRRDRAGTLSWVSGGAQAALGCTPAEAPGTPLARWVADEPCNAPIHLFLAGRPDAPLPSPVQVRVRHAHGRACWVELSEEVVHDAQGAVALLGFARDVTFRREAEARLLRGALHDPLTRLPNRALFMDRLRHVARMADRAPVQRFAVLMVDLDDFKGVNDRHGHDVGDRLLVEVGRRLRQCVRPSDTVCRLGGDEFVLLSPGLGGVDDAVRLAERIVARLDSPFQLGGEPLAVRASVGIAVGPGAHADAAELMREADLALYQAKAAGKGGHALFAPPP